MELIISDYVGEGFAAQSQVPLFIYLTEQSEEGMEAAESLKKNRATEKVPVVFVGGVATVVRTAQSRFEEAYFVEEDELADVLGWIMEG